MCKGGLVKGRGLCIDKWQNEGYRERWITSAPYGRKEGCMEEVAERRD